MLQLKEKDYIICYNICANNKLIFIVINFDIFGSSELKISILNAS